MIDRRTRWIGLVLVLVVLATTPACQPPPVVLDRFLAIRDVRTAQGPTIVFGRCGDELVTGVEVRFSAPPNGVPNNGVVWRISSSGSRQATYVVGQTPPDFEEEVAFAGPELPPWPLEVAVSTTNAMSPTTVLGFRGDDVPRNRFISTDGPRLEKDLSRLSAEGCAPRTLAYR